MISLEHLQARLDALGLSANAASQRAGFSRDYVRDLLRGRVSDPGFSRLSRLAEVLHCDPGYLTGESESVGDFARRLPRPNAVLAPVTLHLQPGFFEPGAAEVADPFELNIAPIGISLVGDYLAYVERAPSVGITLSDDTVLHIVQMDGLYDGVQVLCTVRHPKADLLTYGVFRAQFADPNGSDLIELGDDGRTRPRDLGSGPLIGDASRLLSGDNELGVRIIGRVAASYHYLDRRQLARLKAKARSTT